MAETRAVTASMEDYLEAIFHIVAAKGAARAKDIAKALKVTNASVTGALQSLSARDLVNYAPHDVITLTPSGKAVAKDVVRRHEVLRDFFVRVLAVDKDIAEEGACRMEHAVPKPILERLIQYSEFLEVCPRAGSKWIKGFGYYCDQKQTTGSCVQCISECLEDAASRKEGQAATESRTMTLRDLKPGHKARISKIKGRGGVNRRIMEMGVTPGAVVEIERVAPLGDPIDVKVKGYHLSLRKEEAAGIIVDILE